MPRPKIHVIANQKGGVGKTTVAMNLGATVWKSLANPGPMPTPIFTETAEDRGDPASPVLVVTTDPQASSVWWSDRAAEKAGVPFDFAEVYEPDQVAALLHMDYQHIFVDTPGSLEDERILRRVLDVADDVLVPMLPEPLSFDPTARTIEKVIAPLRIPHRVVVNSWDPRDGMSDLEQTAQYIALRGWPLCRTVIRRYRIHRQAAAEGLVVTQYQRGRVTTEAQNDFLNLAVECGYGGSPALAAPTPDQTAVEV